MAVDTFMTFIPVNGSPLVGESVATAPKDPYPTPGLTAPNFFSIDDWSFDLSQTVNIGSQSTGTGAGKVAFNPLSVTRRIDRASPALFIACASGSTFKYIDLIEVKSGGGGGNAATFLAWRFGVCAITDIGWAQGDEGPSEKLSFEYGTLSMQYYYQDSAGKLVPVPPVGWDRIRNIRT